MPSGGSACQRCGGELESRPSYSGNERFGWLLCPGCGWIALVDGGELRVPRIGAADLRFEKGGAR